MGIKVMLCWYVPVKNGCYIWVSKSCFVDTYLAYSSEIVGTQGFLKVALFGSSTVSFFGFRTLQYAVSGNHFIPPTLLLLSLFFGLRIFPKPKGILFANALSRSSTKAPLIPKRGCRLFFNSSFSFGIFILFTSSSSMGLWLSTGRGGGSSVPLFALSVSTWQALLKLTSSSSMTPSTYISGISSSS